MIKMFSKEYWFIAIAFGLPMAIVLTIFNVNISDVSLTYLITSFCCVMIFAGLMFATLIVLFVQYSFRKTSIILSEEEQLIEEYSANLFRGLEGVGGKIALTDKRIIFQSHKVNIQTGETTIKIIDIQSYKIKNKFWNLLNNEIKIFTDLGDYRFIIQNRDGFIKELKTLNPNI